MLIKDLSKNGRLKGNELFFQLVYIYFVRKFYNYISAYIVCKVNKNVVKTLCVT